MLTVELTTFGHVFIDVQTLPNREKELEALILDWFIKHGKPEDMARHFDIHTQRHGYINE